MRLGHIRAHHYSHRSDNDCPLRNPETARHYNTKHLLASKLRSADAFCVVTECAFSSSHLRCAAVLTSIAAEGWDEVRVEQFIDPIRPDIVLVKADVETLAIEVRATHAVTETKATRLSELGIPWVEVAAGPECDQWMPGALMPAIRYEAELATKSCSKHSNGNDGGAAAQTHPATARSRPTNGSSTDNDPYNHGEPWRFRVVDCYPDKGTRVRNVFWVYCARLNSRTVRLRVADHSDSPVVAELRTAARSDESLREVHSLLRQHLHRTYERFDSPMPWRDTSELPTNPAELYRNDFMPVKYHRDSRGAWTKLIRRADV
jgi:hypothetical protein